MKIIIFSEIIQGHHIEYLHHIYEGSLDDHNQYVFMVPIGFNDLKAQYTWTPKQNVIFDFISREEQDKYLTDSNLRNSYNICKLLSNRVKKYQVGLVYADSMMPLLPFAPILLRGVKIVGIVYQLYLYRWQTSGFIGKYLDALKFWIFSKSNVFKKVLLLNDKSCAIYLNKFFSTCHFDSIVDPHVMLNEVGLTDIRKQYNIPAEKTLLIQFGSLSEDKGTLEILKSIEILNEEQKKRLAFIFAGKISNDIREQFYSCIKQLKDCVQIVVRDEFCEYDYLASICMSCDALLLPYKRTSRSSGLIGYASQFRKPVISSKGGLLGKLVRKYKLGLTMPITSPEELVNAYQKIIDKKCKPPTQNYCFTHRVEDFQNMIKLVLLN